MVKIVFLFTIYNRKNVTLSCLRKLIGILNSLKYTYDIFINDDGSTDGSYEAIKEEFPNIFIFKSEGDLFWNRGMHRIWNIAAQNKYDVYVWLNDDLILFDNAIVNLFAAYERSKGKYILVGATSDEAGITSYSGYNEKDQRINPNGELQPCLYFNGNLVLIPDYVFKKVGNLDSFYSHSLGDWDYGLRASKMNIISMVLPSYVGICNRHDDLPKYLDSKYNIIQRFRYLYSPLGRNPNEIFLFSYRRYGILRACKDYLSLVVKTLLKI